ncbi:MAG: hypothetical protein H0U85_04660 [Gemmatimonadales bacterium]|nr:hypothetical protein [Gemmatimonadales bacterium]
MENILAIIFLFGGGVLSVLAFSPVGRALADRIRGQVPNAPYDPDLLAELHALRTDVGELQERVDFTERLLSQRPEPQQLGMPPHAGHL